MALLLLLVLTASPARAEFRVFMALSAPSDSELEIFQSQMRRALRGLGDVDVVEGGENFNLSVVLLKDETRAGRILGYTAGVLVQKVPDRSLLSREALTALLPECREGDVRNVASTFGIFTRNLVSVELFQILTGPDNLGEMADRIAAAMDGAVLERERQ